MSDFKWGTWYPIESAPKDGQEILLYSPQRSFEGRPCSPRTTLGQWEIPEHGEYLGDCGGECRCPEYDEPDDPSWASYDGGFTTEHPPTHWMPLPPGPDDPAYSPRSTP